MPIIRRAPLIHITREAHARRLDGAVGLPGARARGRTRRPNILIDEPDVSESVVVLLDGIQAQGAVGNVIAFAPTEGFPNEPSGFELAAESTMQTAPGSTWSNSAPGILAGWKRTLDGWSTPTVITPSPSPPHSPPHAIRIRFPKNMIRGHGPGRIDMLHGNPPGVGSGPTEYREIYLSWHILWGPGGDFETHQFWKSYGFFGVGGHQSLIVLGSNHSGVDPDDPATWIDTSLGLRIHQQHPDSSKRFGPIGASGPRLACGQWHHIEVHAGLNDIGSSNGFWKQWHNGVQRMNATGLAFTFADDGSTNGGGFNFWQMNMTWGGAGDATKQRTDDVWVGHMRMSGIPL